MRNYDAKTVGSAYILGIREGREYFKTFPDLSQEEMESEIEIASNLMKSHSGIMKQVFKGQRDFWRNQIKKHK